MKLLIVVALLLSASAARAADVGYIDMDRVYQEASEPARVIAEINNRAAAVNQELADARKHPELSAAAQQHAADFAKYRKEQLEQLKKDRTPIASKLKAERHLADILPVAPLTPTKNDLTDEMIRRWNEADGVSLAAEVARLKAENEKLKNTPAAAPPASPRK
jgi:uncharacterized small protein (DUF1192 family)